MKIIMCVNRDSNNNPIRAVNIPVDKSVGNVEQHDTRTCPCSMDWQRGAVACKSNNRLSAVGSGKLDFMRLIQLAQDLKYQ
jgi:hypothetical protein